jgi:glutamate racemase
MSSAPIGIFDSGVGGLTVARAILDQLPNESTIYIGDTARGPYGPRPLAEVRDFSLETIDFLVDQGVKAVVIACNTASAAMLRDARERYSVPVIEVIQPAVRRAVAATRSGRIGVIGTATTIESRAYLDAFAAAPHLEITDVACPAFVLFLTLLATVFHSFLALKRQQKISIEPWSRPINSEVPLPALLSTNSLQLEMPRALRTWRADSLGQKLVTYAIKILSNPRTTQR